MSKSADEKGGSEWLWKLREDLAPFRESITHLSDDEIKAVVEEVLEEVRAERRAGITRTAEACRSPDTMDQPD